MLCFIWYNNGHNHAGSATSTAESIAAPNSLATAKSHLSKEFDLLGRTGAWTPHSQQGNPVESIHIREFVKGYKNHASELGYQKRGAVPLEEADMIQLLQQLYLQQQTLTGTDQLLLLRDGFARRNLRPKLKRCRECYTYRLVCILQFLGGPQPLSCVIVLPHRL